MSAETWQHGHGGYTNHGCRCEVCRAAQRQYQADLRARYAVRLAAGEAVPHGSSSTYTNWGCRCPECRAAHSVKQAS